jgi:hypothetical protein
MPEQPDEELSRKSHSFDIIAFNLTEQSRIVHARYERLLSMSAIDSNKPVFFKITAKSRNTLLSMVVVNWPAVTASATEWVAWSGRSPLAKVLQNADPDRAAEHGIHPRRSLNRQEDQGHTGNAPDARDRKYRMRAWSASHRTAPSAPRARGASRR